MRDEQAIETEATELLRTLIRNRCVNDGTAASGQETRSVVGARGVLQRRGRGLRALHLGARAREPHRAHRGLGPEGPAAAPDGSHRRGAGEPGGLAARSLRRRAGRRSGVGPRRHRHAEPHHHHGGGDPAARPGRLSPARHPHLPGGGGRGGGRQPGRGLPGGPATRDGEGGLRHHRERRRAHPHPRRARPRRHRRREGRQLAPADGGGHAGPRLAALPHRQRARDRGGGRAAHRGLPAEGAHPRRVARVREGDGPRPRADPGPHRSRAGAGHGARAWTTWPSPARRTPAPTPPSRPTSSTGA